MSYLREAVDQQKILLIKKLTLAGVILPDDTNIDKKTITELEILYKKAVLEKEKTV